MSAYGWVVPPINRYGTVERQCTGKWRYASKQEARRAAKLRPTWNVRPYRCAVCGRGRWHLGNRRPDRA